MEKEVERFLTREIKKMGGRCLKWVCPGHDGVPDRIVLLPGGRVWFVELKTEIGRPTAVQRHWQRVLAGLGFKAVILHGLREVDAFLQMVRGAGDGV
jgi:hypothetical protein